MFLCSDTFLAMLNNNVPRPTLGTCTCRSHKKTIRNIVGEIIATQKYDITVMYCVLFYMAFKTVFMKYCRYILLLLMKCGLNKLSFPNVIHLLVEFRCLDSNLSLNVELGQRPR